ncbi:hypothetical protein QUB68_11080 [Microcoleus sp. A006_D1]|uniref:hypothetical protein n=1 Tax=Microcoleus sp. A006_D1 TaxID=3055267 RepID=UPI002FD1B9C9
MKSLKTGLIVVGSAALMLLAAYSNTVQATNATNKPDDFLAQIPAKNSSTAPTLIAGTGHSKESKGGQVVESGPYHLELVVEKEADKTHLDFYLQRGDNHQTIPNAKVTSQIQMPDRTQKTVTFTYDQKDQHYTALLPGKVVGQYQMKITADISGQKVDGRFTFSR